MTMETNAVAMEATCEELGNALARQQSLLSDLARAQTVLVGGATVGGELLPGSTMGEPNNTVIESEIARIQSAMRDQGCE